MGDKMEPTISSGKHLARCADLGGSRFEDVNLGGAEFENVNLANAVFHATGRRVRDLPIRIEKLL